MHVAKRERRIIYSVHSPAFCAHVSPASRAAERQPSQPNGANQPTRKRINNCQDINVSRRARTPPNGEGGNSATFSTFERASSFLLGARKLRKWHSLRSVRFALSAQRSQIRLSLARATILTLRRRRRMPLMYSYCRRRRRHRRRRQCGES